MNTNYPRVVIAAANSRAGKTTLTMGIISALNARGLTVQPFKAGPDYIDPGFHTLASGRPCRNLDTWMLSRNAVLELFKRSAQTAGISIIEGVMGLYDGLKGTEQGSTAHLAKILNAPVILVVNAGSMSRSAAAIVLGFKEFDKQVNIKGIILNNIASQVHYSSIKDAVEKRTAVPVLGFLPREKNLVLTQRHLGLTPTDEKSLPVDFTRRLRKLIEKNIDVNRIIEISRNASGLASIKERIFCNKPATAKAVIAVAKDEAFNFYYQDNLDILSHYGAQLLTFSPLRDKKLPQDTDGIYIGGGFPELFAKRLSGNTALKRQIYECAQDGMPIYAECGGLMYLMKELIDFKGRRFPMAGIFRHSVKMAARLRGLGYVEISNRGMKVRAHTFHWSYIDGASKREIRDGFVRQNVLAGYSHVHFASSLKFARNFIKSCMTYKNKRARQWQRRQV